MLKNVLHKFFMRLLLVFLLSSLAGISIVYVVMEAQLGAQVHAELAKEKQGYLRVFQILEKHPEQFEQLFDQHPQRDNTLLVEIFDRQRQPVLKYRAPSLSRQLSTEIRAEDLLSATQDHKILYEGDDYFLYFHEQMSQADGGYYVNVLMKLDEQTVFFIENNAVTGVVVVLLTLVLVSLSIFPIIYTQYRSLVKGKRELTLSNIETLKSLGNAIAKRDSDTHAHNYRVTYYSVKIAEKMALPPRQIEELIKGAFLHDIGKIAISDNILLKPGKLDAEEFQIMQSHVTHGVDIVKDGSWLAEARKVILYHHEKVDGSGYPQGLVGEAIPLEARIFAIADVFDALTSARPYKQAFAPDRSMAIIRGDAGRHFDPAIVAVFEEIHLACFNSMNDSDERQLDRIFQQSLMPYFFHS